MYEIITNILYSEENVDIKLNVLVHTEHLSWPCEMWTLFDQYI